MLRSSQLMEHLFGEEEVTEEQGSASQVGISSASTTDLKGGTVVTSPHLAASFTILLAQWSRFRTVFVRAS